MSTIEMHAQGTVSSRGSFQAGKGARAVPHLVLTQRGRRLLQAVVLIIAFGTLLFGGLAVAGGRAEPIAVDTYTVSAGETLWAIASANTPSHGDVRDTVRALVDLNDLAGGALRAGEQVLIPVG